MPKPVRKGKNYPYRSGFEKKFAEFLDTRKVPYAYEVDTLKISVDTTRVYCGDCGSTRIKQDTVYTPDFKANGIYLECKGRLTAKERRRILGVKGCHPTIDFRLVFMRNNPLYPRSKTKYTDWAAQHNIPHCVGHEIPNEWIKELGGKPVRRKRVKT